MPHFILGVAGHVDHGKTALTYALTGVETDRLAEEKRRGLTIEVGFAPLPLAGGCVAALVDVPGHEKFIRNMLAGASGMDAVLLVVAAPDGVMPQTREHLDICALLGMTRGLVALTKCDRADGVQLARVEAQVRALTAGSFLEHAPILPVSAHTGTGLTELKAAIEGLAQAAAPQKVPLPFRMAVDRVFTKDGFGTVVTGTVTESTVQAGQVVCIYPGGKTARIRGIQSHGTESAHLEVGRRAALNLAGIDGDEIQRGDTVANPDSMVVSTQAEVTLTLLPDAAFPVKTGSQLHFYSGTRALLCRCTLVGQKTLLPGARCRARLRFSAPLAGRVGDRFVVRFFSPAVTVGGGVLEVLSTGGGSWREQSARRGEDVTAILADYHAKFPLRDGMNRQEFMDKTGGASPEELASQKIIKLRGALVALPAFRPKYTPELAKLRDRLEVAYRRFGLEPKPNDSVDCREVADRLVRDGVLIPLGGQYRVHRVPYGRALETLRRLGENGAPVTLARFRDALAISRKYALLLLEHCDSAGITEKQGDTRILLPRMDAFP